MIAKNGIARKFFRDWPVAIIVIANQPNGRNAIPKNCAFAQKILLSKVGLMTSAAKPKFQIAAQSDTNANADASSDERRRNAIMLRASKIVPDKISKIRTSL
ncbi:MAG: hypothetical protein Kow0088_06920 [Anaerolineales bacterium]